jgi:predicted regulator of Ras-like GTPase activity (Roadblock/LC7/MglB family)
MAASGQQGSRLDLAGTPRMSRAREFREVLGDLGGLAGVRGGLIVTPDGLVVTADLPPRIPAEALAALAATLGRELEVGAHELGRGAFKTAFFSADDGTVFVGGSPIGFLILVTDASADPPSVTLALKRALTRLAGTWRGPDGA